MRTVVRNSFARQSITAEVVSTATMTAGCTECGNVRHSRGHRWLYRFHLEPDSGRTQLIASGKLFCSRGCCETYIGQSFSE